MGNLHYVLIVVQTREKADALNATLPLASDVLKIQAVFYGQAICGLHHRGQRPNIIVEHYTDIFAGGGWRNEVLLANAAHDAVWV
ncbi:hypothetical protein [Paenibacillus sp. P22]|uniref:hypothetical protein n=1 Tax=Paenibacillus sp. P22 TaxID=483908 RepID=UPI00038FFBF0|nr:hypothetical protein [Paenibacillus sp. P22]CDN42015.1 hypothetical protein BN871_AT_00170 [Paenibacillus sp. P22]